MDFTLSAGERRTFLLLAAGHVLFVAALFTVAERFHEYGLYVIAPLFGLPLAVMGRGDRRLVRALVLLLGFALVHYGAVFCATQSFHIPYSESGFTEEVWVSGAIGGAIGAGGAFLLCALAGLFRLERQGMLVAALIALTAIGALGVQIFFDHVGGTEGMAPPTPYLFIYTPWQLAFAWFLAKLLRN
jgi:hypothetical protein